MRFSFIILTLLISINAFCIDITDTFHKHYASSTRLSHKDLSYLKNLDVILVPGILSEVFIWEDHRGKVDFSWLTTNYFGAQLRHLRDTLGLRAVRLRTSSKNVNETKENIRKALAKSRQEGRKVLFITHSLGGLALLDHLVESDESEWEDVAGMMFLQTPFYGSPIADVFFDNPYHADKWLKPLMPFFNTSPEMVDYLTVKNRTRQMKEQQEIIKKLVAKVPAYTMTGLANGHKTLFRPAVDVIKHGCLINAKGKCFTQKLYFGEYDDSDGMVPVRSSKLQGVDFVTLDGVDHSEAIVKLPFQTLSKEILAEVMVKMLIER